MGNVDVVRVNLLWERRIGVCNKRGERGRGGVWFTLGICHPDVGHFVARNRTTYVEDIKSVVDTVDLQQSASLVSTNVYKHTNIGVSSQMLQPQ